MFSCTTVAVVLYAIELVPVIDGLDGVVATGTGSFRIIVTFSPWRGEYLTTGSDDFGVEAKTVQ